MTYRYFTRWYCYVLSFVFLSVLFHKIEISSVRIVSFTSLILNTIFNNESWEAVRKIGLRPQSCNVFIKSSPAQIDLFMLNMFKEIAKRTGFLCKPYYLIFFYIFSSVRVCVCTESKCMFSYEQLLWLPGESIQCSEVLSHSGFCGNTQHKLRESIMHFKW